MGIDLLHLVRYLDASQTASLPLPGRRAKCGDESPTAEELELFVSILNLFAISIVDRDSVQFVRAMAETLIWSAEHARLRSVTEYRAQASALPEWDCAPCGEPNPGTFDLCWNCGVDHTVGDRGGLRVD